MKILNFGSLNIDKVYKVKHFVRPGETIFSEEYQCFPGGKGLNQSIAAARAGVPIYHAGTIGPDGRFLAELLKESGVDTRYLRENGSITGHALIQVSEEGENCIILLTAAIMRTAENSSTRCWKISVKEIFWFCKTKSATFPIFLKKAPLWECGFCLTLRR